MMDPKKLIDTADYHIKRGDSMVMDPVAIKTLGLMVQAAQETLEQNLHLADGENCTLRALRDAYLKINPDWGQQEDPELDDFPECLHCGGAELEVVSKTEIATQPDSVNERLLSAAEKYFTGYCQDEASAFGAEDTGCTDDQHKDAAELRDAIAAAKAEAKAQPAPDVRELVAVLFNAELALNASREHLSWDNKEGRDTYHLAIKTLAEIRTALAKHKTTHPGDMQRPEEGA